MPAEKMCIWQMIGKVILPSLLMKMSTGMKNITPRWSKFRLSGNWAAFVAPWCLQRNEF